MSIAKLLIIIFILFTPFNINFIAGLISPSFLVFLDVGQGDSILICKNTKQCGLVDTGKGYNIEQQIKRYTDSKLEFVVITHSDKDHIGGLESILRSIGTKKIFINQTNHSKEILSNLILNFQPKQFHQLNDLNDFAFGDYIFDILWPLDSTDSNLLSTNDSSITINLKYKNSNIFIGGDLGIVIENKLLTNTDLSNIDVLKLGHHGSNSSSSYEFLARTNPKLGIISVGKNNAYKHPSTEVLDNIAKLSIKTLRTDLDGDIRVYFKEFSMEIYTEISKKSYIILNNT